MALHNSAPFGRHNMLSASVLDWGTFLPARNTRITSRVFKFPPILFTFFFSFLKYYKNYSIFLDRTFFGRVPKPRVKYFIVQGRVEVIFSRHRVTNVYLLLLVLPLYLSHLCGAYPYIHMLAPTSLYTKPSPATISELNRILPQV